MDMPTLMPSGRRIKYRRVEVIRAVAACPRCGRNSRRHSVGRRLLREVGVAGPTVLEVLYSRHFCLSCVRHFGVPLDHLAEKSSRYTNRVRNLALALLDAEGRTLAEAGRRLRERFYVHVPETTLHGWRLRHGEVV